MVSVLRQMRSHIPALVALSILMLALLGSAVRGLHELATWQREAAAELIAGNHFAGQAQAHAMRTSSLIEALKDGDPEASVGALTTQFEVLWSRIDLLTRDRDALATLGRLGLVEKARELGRMMAGAEPILLALASSGDVDQLEHRVSAISSSLASIALALGQLDVDQRQLVEREQRRQFARFRDLIGLFVLSGALMALLMMRAIGRQQQHLAAAESALRQARSAQRDLRSVIDAVPAMIAATDDRGGWLFANRFYMDFFAASGRDRDGIDDPSAIEVAIAEAGSGRSAAELGAVPSGSFVETVIADSAGQERVLLASRVPIADGEGEGEAGRSVAVALDITDRKRAEERMHYLAEHDPLTGLANRTRLMAELERSLRESSLSGQALALFLIDLDEFKEVNDTLGHAAGDELLVAVAARLKALTGGRGVIGRLGGDEFALLWPVGRIADGTALTEIAVDTMTTALLASIVTPVDIAGQTVRVSASVGIARAPEHGLDSMELLRCADLALYAAKRAGRSCARPFDAELAAEAQRRRRLVDDLRTAITSGGLRLEYQPKYRVADSALCGVEALLRWDHPELGAIGPVEFVPLAEESGLIGALGDWVIDEACRQIAAWGPAMGARDFTVAINLSAAQLAHGDVAAVIDRALARHAINPRRLEVEVTESLFVKDAGRARDIFERLRARGIKVAIDDFGTGFSSLAYLVRLPFDVLKIDRAFTTEATCSVQGRAVMQAIVSLASSLGARVVAEGVETEAQLAVLREIGCDEAQGWLLGRSCRARDVVDLLRAAGQAAGDRPAPRGRSAAPRRAPRLLPLAGEPAAAAARDGWMAPSGPTDPAGLAH